MLAPITRQYKDLSTPESFLFAFYCDRCGKEWQSDLYAFNLKGFEPPVDEKIRSMVWSQQHEEAYERANREASAIYIRCAECGCRICDDCFYTAGRDACDICKACDDKKNT